MSKILLAIAIGTGGLVLVGGTVVAVVARRKKTTYTRLSTATGTVHHADAHPTTTAKPKFVLKPGQLSGATGTVKSVTGVNADIDAAHDAINSASVILEFQKAGGAPIGKHEGIVPQSGDVAIFMHDEENPSRAPVLHLTDDPRSPSVSVLGGILVDVGSGVATSGDFLDFYYPDGTHMKYAQRLPGHKWPADSRGIINAYDLKNWNGGREMDRLQIHNLRDLVSEITGHYHQYAVCIGEEKGSDVIQCEKAMLKQKTLREFFSHAWDEFRPWLAVAMSVVSCFGISGAGLITGLGLQFIDKLGGIGQKIVKAGSAFQSVLKSDAVSAIMDMSSRLPDPTGTWGGVLQHYDSITNVEKQIVIWTGYSVDYSLQQINGSLGENNAVYRLEKLVIYK